MLPYLTSDLAGIGGALRTEIADFIVDEEPAYLPSGTGDHVFARVEKRDVTTPAMIAAIARALGINERDIGVAGMKDRRAITRQWISLPPPVAPEQVTALALEGIAVLEVARHQNKLRTGHLRGNRFALVVRGAHADALERARAIFARLALAPNYYGEQRFGHDGDNADRGRALVLGTSARSGKDRRMNRLMVSALQSDLFNRWLAARITDGLYARAIAGDVFHKTGGGMFATTDPAVDEPRIAAGEIVPTGPMFGADMRAPAPGTLAAAREAAILDASGLAIADFARVRAIAEGTRRDAAIHVRDVTIELLHVSSSSSAAASVPAESSFSSPSSVASSVPTESSFSSSSSSASSSASSSSSSSSSSSESPSTPSPQAAEPTVALALTFALPSGAYATTVMREVMKLELE